MRATRDNVSCESPVKYLTKTIVERKFLQYLFSVENAVKINKGCKFAVESTENPVKMLPVPKTLPLRAAD